MEGFESVSITNECVASQRKTWKHCPKSCSDFDDLTEAGVHVIFPQSISILKPIHALCEPGGWTVIQRRNGESTSSTPDFFYRSYYQYTKGFGNVYNDEFWLGNFNIYALTLQEKVYLQIELQDWEGQTKTGETGAFRLLGSENFEIAYDGFSGELGPDLPPSGTIFSSYDKENPNIKTIGGQSANLAEKHKGGWWYSSTPLGSNLNGLNLKGEHFTEGDGINWKSFKGVKYSLKTSKMRIRPLSMKNQ